MEMEETAAKKASSKPDESKETRWDRISKKHLNAVHVTTENVKKFFGMEFVNEHQLRALNGESMRRYAANPMLVMNMRHEVIRQTPKAKPAIHLDPVRAIQMEKVQAHNHSVEERYLANKIKKFQLEMDANRNRNSVKPKLVVMMNQPLRNQLADWDNSQVLQALAQGHEAVQDFYRNSYNSKCSITEIEPDIVELSDDEEVPHIEHIGDIVADNVHAIASNEQKDRNIESDERCVRFGDVVEIINYSDSVATDSASLVGSVIDKAVPAAGQSESNKLTVALTPKLRKEPFELELVGRHMQTEIQTDMLKIPSPRVNAVKELTLSRSGELETGLMSPLTITKFSTVQRKNCNAIDVPVEQPPEQNTIIAELFNKNILGQEAKRTILQKYFQQWIHYTTIAKMNSQNMLTNKSRARTIETFLNHIRLEKKKLTVKPACEAVPKVPAKEDPTLLAKKYNNKLKIQQDIIDLQKLKLERQERMITELKLNKIEEETRDSQAIAKQELRNVIKTGCAKSKTTARCLQLVANLKDNDEPDEYAKLQARGVPKFLIEMQARAWERNQRHQEARDRRERLERVKEEQRVAAEQAKRQQDEEAKRQRIVELQEKRRQERLQKQQREQDRLRYIANQQKATAFYRRLLLTRCGIDRFRRLIKLKRRNQKRAEEFHRTMLSRNIFKVWLARVHQIWDYRKRKADAFYAKYLLRTAMDMWIKYQQVQHSKMLVAIDWYEMKIAEHFMGAWDGYTRQQKLLFEVKMRQAQTHYNWHLKWRVIEHWQRLHTILRLEKETDERRMRWRMKIWELQPDYTPNPDVS